MQISKTWKNLQSSPRTWLVTGAAGFIGSHLVEELLKNNQRVIGFDNFSTGKQENLAKSANFKFIQGDITNPQDLKFALQGVDLILHQAALGSVPRSIENPQASHAANVDGFINLLIAAKDAGIKRIVYASSSSVYGDSPVLPKVEEQIGKPLSPYAATKLIDEIYADVFAKTYAMELVGLRYFNVFGIRQDPHGAYAAVIPRWLNAIKNSEPIKIFGDGLTSRDFCFVKNVVQANVLAATSDRDGASHSVYNIACGDQLTLTDLAQKLLLESQQYLKTGTQSQIIYEDFRAGDVRHSKADISKAQSELGFEPEYNVEQGIRELVREFFGNS